MKGAGLFLATIAALTWGLAEVSAHHPFSSTYLFDQQVTIEGDIVALILRHPHSFVNVTARDRNDHVRQWAVEWVGTQGAGGLDAPLDALKVGDHVVITGSPGRDPRTFRLLPRTIVRPKDGWRWGKTAQ